jgi:hypothetical protein
MDPEKKQAVDSDLSQADPTERDLNHPAYRSQSSAQSLDELQKRLSEQNQAVKILSEQLALKEAQLDKITGSFGWRILSRYGRIKYKYLLPAYRLFNRTSSGPKGPATNPD